MKVIQCAKRTFYGVDGNVKKKVLRCLKKGYFEKKSVISYLFFVFFWPVRFWDIIFLGIIQTGLELSVC